MSVKIRHIIIGILKEMTVKLKVNICENTQEFAWHVVSIQKILASFVLSTKNVLSSMSTHQNIFKA